MKTLVAILVVLSCSHAFAQDCPPDPTEREQLQSDFFKRDPGFQDYWARQHRDYRHCQEQRIDNLERQLQEERQKRQERENVGTGAIQH